MARNREVFGREEADFLKSQAVGRLATLTADGSPTVVPVGFDIEAGNIRVIGHELTSSAKWRNLGRDPRFAFVVDEGVGRTARGVQIRGEAVLGDAVVVLVPRRVVTWGITTDPYVRHSRDV